MKNVFSQNYVGFVILLLNIGLTRNFPTKTKLSEKKRFQKFAKIKKMFFLKNCE